MALGDDHPDTLTAVYFLALLLYERGEFQEASSILAAAEQDARRVFAHNNPRRLARFLVLFGRARAGLGYDAERFTLAEANLLEAHPILVQARGETHKDTLDCVQGLVDLYTAWHAAEPDQGHDAKAAEWRARLPAAGPP